MNSKKAGKTHRKMGVDMVARSLYNSILSAAEQSLESRLQSGEHAPLAQLVEQLTLNQRVLGSSP